MVQPREMADRHGNGLTGIEESRAERAQVDGVQVDRTCRGLPDDMYVQGPLPAGQQHIAIGGELTCRFDVNLDSLTARYQLPIRRRIAVASGGIEPEAVGPTFSR